MNGPCYTNFLLSDASMNNTIPLVPSRHKKRKGIMTLQYQKIVHNSNDNYKVDMTNNDCVHITSNKWEIPHILHGSFETMTKSELPFVTPKMDETRDVIEGMVRVIHDVEISNRKLSDHSAYSEVDKKTEITDDLAIDNCDTSDNYVENISKITKKFRIIETAVEKKQMRLDKNFVCAINSSINSDNGRNFGDMGKNNNNCYDYEETNINSKPLINITSQNNNNNDNNMFRVNVCVSPKQACYNAISADKDKGRIERYVERYKSYKHKMVLMYSERINRNPTIADGHNDGRVRNNGMDTDVSIKSSKHHDDCTSKKNSSTIIFQHSTVQPKSDNNAIIKCNTNPVNFAQNATVAPVIPCLKIPTQTNHREHRKKFVKFDSHSDTVNFGDTKELNRKSPTKPIAQEFQVNTETDSRQIIRIMNNDSNSNQVFELKTLDQSNISAPERLGKIDHVNMNMNARYFVSSRN